MRSSSLQASVFFRKSQARWDREVLLSMCDMGMCLIFLSSSFSSLAFQGGQPISISQHITPSDHMSHLVVYVALSKIWGAMQIGLPTQLLSICEPKLSTYLANPKSPILQVPSLMRMLAGLRSRWTIFSRMSSLKPLRICRVMSNTSSSLNLRRFMSSLRSPFLQNSVMMQRLFLELRTSLNLTMLAWLNRFNRQISEKMAFQRYLSLVKVARSIFLMATFSFDSRSMPSQTLPQTPSPRHLLVWQEQFPITFITTSFISDVGLVIVIVCFKCSSMHHPPPTTDSETNSYQL